MSLTVEEKILVLDNFYPELTRVVRDGVLTYPTLTEPPLTEQEFIDKYNKLVFDLHKAKKRDEINSIRDVKLEEGMPWDFNGVSPDIMQTRATDKINLLGIHSEARMLDLDNVTDPVLEIRALSNQNYFITPQEAIVLTRQAGYYTSGVLKTSWNLKDTLDSMEYGTHTLADIDSVVWP